MRGKISGLAVSGGGAGSRARRVTRARGTPVPFAVHVSAIMSSAMTVTRSPLRTDSAVLVASTPYAVTLTHRVTLSPLPRAGISTAMRSSTPSEPSRVRNVRGSSPSRPVMLIWIGFTGCAS